MRRLTRRSCERSPQDGARLLMDLYQVTGREYSPSESSRLSLLRSLFVSAPFETRSHIPCGQVVNGLDVDVSGGL